MNILPSIFGMLGLFLVAAANAEDDPFAKKKSAAEKAISDAACSRASLLSIAVTNHSFDAQNSNITGPTAITGWTSLITANGASDTNGTCEN